MLSLLHAGAVPFGYTTDMNDSDPLPYHRPGCAINALEISWWQHPHHYYHDHHHHHHHYHHHHLDVYGSRLLPDVITSNTPPPSPLRRSHSCLAFFPEKPQAQAAATPPAPPGIEGGAEGVPRQAGLSHSQEVERQVHSDAHDATHLPPLLWPLPRPRSAAHHHHHHHHHHRQGDEVRRAGREDGERQRLWRNIGGDLRKIADQFQSNGCGGSTQVAVPASSLPVIFYKCLAGSLLCLVWWRLYSGSS